MKKTLPELVDLLLCDDVRREHDGRFSLMGVYPGKRVTIDQLPTIVSHLCFVLRLKGLAEDEPLWIKVVAPDGHESQAVQGRLVGKASMDGDATFVVQAAPIQLSESGLHRVRLRCGQHLMETAFSVHQSA